MLLKISDRLAQAFGINLSRLLPGFVRLFSCVPRASWLSAPLGFRFISLIYFHALPPKLLERWIT
jgi:pimeloyl-ACP methyl ester carboxylesterase